MHCTHIRTHKLIHIQYMLHYTIGNMYGQLQSSCRYTPVATHLSIQSLTAHIIARRVRIEASRTGAHVVGVRNTLDAARGHHTVH